MRVGLLGCTGRVGGKVMTQCLARGHTVRALARSPEKVTLTHDKLVIEKGSSTNADDVNRLTEQTDVIVVCVGAGGGVLTKTAACVIGASPKRVVALSNIGVRKGSLILNFLMKNVVVGREVVADLEELDAAFLNAPCACTVLRPVGFADKPGKGKYVAQAANATFISMTPRTISMDDVALALVDMITDTKWDGSEGVHVYPA